MFHNKYPLGISDFAEIVENKYTLIDKTMFVKDIMENPAKVILLTRPRRFGKTLAMMMLGEFLKIDGKDVFDGLQISRDKEFCATYQNQYPVIFISFKDCKGSSLEKVFTRIRSTFSDCYKHHEYLLDSSVLSLSEKEEFLNILNKKISNFAQLEDALKNLISYLHAHTGKNVVILIDEYDSPIHSAYEHGFYEEMIEFMRVLLGAALKDNSLMAKCVITGICRVSQESLFSGLNHVRCYTVLDKQYAQYFGFTGDEVESLLSNYSSLAPQNSSLMAHGTSESEVLRCALDDKGGALDSNSSLSSRGQSPKDLTLGAHGNGALDDKVGGNKELSQKIKNWYNGYAIGGLRIYNPWSILECLSNEAIIIPYWVNTSDNSLVHKLINGSRENVKEGFEGLISGIPQHRTINNNLVFKYLENDDGAIWTLLIHAGYLNVTSKTIDDEGLIQAVLEIPNKEVMSVYVNMVRNWFTTQRYESGTYEQLVKALETGNIDAFARQIGEYLLESGSYFDFTKHTPERVFHVFILGILVGMRARYTITSNRERGLGRADMVMIPKDTSKPTIVLEFKSCSNPSKLQEEADNALDQIKQKQYAPGSSTLISMVFCGKEMVCKTAYL